MQKSKALLAILTPMFCLVAAPLVCNGLKALDNAPPLAQAVPRNAAVALLATFSWSGLCVSLAILVAFYTMVVEPSTKTLQKCIIAIKPIAVLYAAIMLDTLVYYFLLDSPSYMVPHKYLYASITASIFYLSGIIVSTMLAASEALKLRRAPRSPEKLLAMAIVVLVAASLTRLLVEVSLSWLTPHTVIYTCRCSGCAAHLCRDPLCWPPRAWIAISVPSYIASSSYVLVYSLLLDALSLIDAGTQ